VLALEALDKGDYARAADLYRRALGQTPDSLPLRYGLGVALSHLGRKEEAIREFRWVLERGPAGSAEVEAARRWLASVGALPRPVAAAPPAQDEGRKPGHAMIQGRAMFAEAGQPVKPMPRIQLFLVGQPDSPSKEERYVLRTDEEGYFRFRNVAPGTYKLTNRIAGPPIWRLRLEVKASEEMTLDLTPANSVAARDDFPTQR
jgi:tetratricopeptide (TPR) repeat protein